MKKVMLALATAALTLPIASATDPPAVKEGLWSVHTEITNNPGSKKTEGEYTLCRDHAFDQLVREREKSMKGCSMLSENLQDNKYTSEIRCAAGTITIESKGTTTYQGDSAVHSESHATYTPALGGVSDTTIVRDEKFVGSCPAGAEPGDRTNPDGTVIHLGKK
jgi:hypothetical protein